MAHLSHGLVWRWQPHLTDTHRGEIGNFGLKMFPPARLGMLSLPGEELQLQGNVSASMSITLDGHITTHHECVLFATSYRAP